jgi:RNA polymerase sigma-70 factor (ECF subfamily)
MGYTQHRAETRHLQRLAKIFFSAGLRGLSSAPASCKHGRMKVMDDGLLDLPPVRDEALAGGPSVPGTVARLFKEHARRMGRVLSRHLRNPDDADDASQDLFLKLWRREQAGELRGEATAYMNSAAITIAIDVERRRRSRGDDRISETPLEELQQDAASNDETLHWREGVQALVASLAELPPLTQQVFLLYHFEGLSHAAVARRLRISLRSVERHMARALAHCKNGLKDYL